MSKWVFKRLFCKKEEQVLWLYAKDHFDLIIQKKEKKKIFSLFLQISEKANEKMSNSNFTSKLV